MAELTQESTSSSPRSPASCYLPAKLESHPRQRHQGLEAGFREWQFKGLTCVSETRLKSAEPQRGHFGTAETMYPNDGKMTLQTIEKESERDFMWHS